jgi:hypothetical protein
LAPEHVVYALYGVHHQYGNQVLLYIGKTGVDLGTRLAGHVEWVNQEWETSTMRVKAASVGPFASVDAWWNSYDPKARYKKADAKLVGDVESLLIYAHQPAYNAQGKGGLNPKCQPLRVFNTGQVGSLLPEVSYAYFCE